MPSLNKLAITNLRNISTAEMNPSAGFNIFCGFNGSGKTSILEAIYLLALGRSFRSHLQKPLIKDGESSTIIYGETSDSQTLGIQRFARGSQIIQLNGKKPSSMAALTRSLPLQLINSSTFEILEGGPKGRREFLDWGVFHVEHGFLNHWRSAKTALLHRNSLLKAGASAAEMEPWSMALAKNAVQIDMMRKDYITEFQAEFEPLIDLLLGPKVSNNFQFSYWRGWDPEMDLLPQLELCIARDRRHGFTTSGPHKADLYFKIDGANAVDVLSRGQLKLFICGLKVAQSRLLQRLRGLHCVFLIDDLPAELDPPNREKISMLLAELQDQVFISSIEVESLLPHIVPAAQQQGVAVQVFHVKHGIIVNGNLA